MNLLTLYVDITNGKIVQDASNTARRTLPTLYQGDVIPIRIFLLQANHSGGLLSPYSYVTDSSLVVHLGLVTPGATSSTEHAKATLSYVSGSPGYWEGTLAMGAGIDSLLGSSLQATCSLEVELYDATSGATRTVVQIDVVVKADGLKAGSPPEPPPGDSYPTTSEIAAAYVRKIGLPGDSITLTSPDGTKQVVIWVDDDGVLHQDTI